MSRKTPEDYHALAKRRGFKWLGPEVPNVATKTGWECGEGHQWEALYKNIQKGSGCPICVGEGRKLPEDYHALAELRGFKWLGPEVPNVSTKTGWECGQGHQWKATYSSVRLNAGCPVCGGTARKKSEDYHALAESRGFKWLGPEVSNTATKTGWECGQGHQWETPYSHIRHGSGCPLCARWARKTPEDYHALAKRRGFSWVGPTVKNAQTKTGWRCSQGHEWQARYKDIYRGKGCPGCAKQRVELGSVLKHLSLETLARMAVELEPEIESSEKVRIAYQKVLTAGRRDGSGDFEEWVAMLAGEGLNGEG